MSFETWHLSTSKFPVYIQERKFCSLRYGALYTHELQSMGTIRQTDFLHGRYLAHQVLGASSFKIARSESGAPVFPEGMRGSISHSRDFVCVGLTKEVSSLGIDVEEIFAESFYHEIKAKVFTPSERSLIETSESIAAMATLIFSAKESFYKCYHPHFKQFIDFHEVSFIELIPDGQFTLSFQGLTFEGFSGRRGDAVCTLMYKS